MASETRETRDRSSRAKKLANWIDRSPAALALIGLASLLESTVVPIPLELVLVPLLYRRRHQTWTICTIVTLACLAGATLFYGAGQFFFERWGETLLALFGGGEESAQRFQELMNQHGFWAVLLFAISPLPFQAAMLMAGAASYSFPLFLLASAIGRGIRYYGLGWLVKRYGQRAADFWQQHRLKASLLGTALILALWALSHLASQWLN